MHLFSIIDNLNKYLFNSSPFIPTYNNQGSIHIRIQIKKSFGVFPNLINKKRLQNLIQSSKRKEIVIRVLQMKSKQGKDNREKSAMDDIFFIGNDVGDAQGGFQSLHDFKYGVNRQQQQVMMVGGEGRYEKFGGIHEVTIQKGQLQSSDQLNKEFQEIRFGTDQCNLIDMDMPTVEQTKSVFTLSPYEYQKFIQHRVIEIETPQVINQGYILSYKLYQVKTKVISKPQEKFLFQKQIKIKKGLQASRDKYSQRQSEQDKNKKKIQSQYDTCVSRRFSDFQYFNQLLIDNYGGYIIPLLPIKNFWTILNLQGKQFAQYRTKSLTQYLNRLLSHKTLKKSIQLKKFLFQEDTQFSTQKGEYLQKNNHIEDKIISLGTGAFEYGKALYNKFVGGQEKGKDEEQIRLTKSKLTKEELVMSEYEIIVAELMRIMSDLKFLVQNTVEQIRTSEDIKTLFCSPLTDPFQRTHIIKPQTHPADQEQQQLTISAHEISQQFQQISQFIESCHAAILRRKALQREIQSLKQQQQVLTEKYKNSPRSLELDIVRSKQNRLNKINQTYAEELVKQLQFHIDQGKGMLKLFVTKFQKLKKQFFQLNSHLTS